MTFIKIKGKLNLGEEIKLIDILNRINEYVNLYIDFFWVGIDDLMSSSED